MSSVRPYMSQQGGEVIGSAEKIKYDEDYDNALIDFRVFPFASRYSYNTSIASSEYITINPQTFQDNLMTLTFNVNPDNSNAMWDLQNSFFDLDLTVTSPDNPPGTAVLSPGLREYASWLLFNSCRVSINGTDVNDSSETQDAHISAWIKACLTRRRDYCVTNITPGPPIGLIMHDTGDYATTLIQSPPYMDASTQYHDYKTYGAYQCDMISENDSKFPLKYTPTNGLWEQSGFLPCSVSIEINLTKFDLLWSFVANNHTDIPVNVALNKITLQMRRVTLTNKALAEQKALLADPRTGGYLQYKFLTQRITPHYIPGGSNSLNIQIMSTKIPECLVLFFVAKSHNTSPCPVDCHPYFTTGHRPLASFQSLYVQYGGKRYPITGTVNRAENIINFYFNKGGTSEQEYIEYKDLVGRYSSENQPWLSKAVFTGGSVNMYFINMVDAFQGIDRKNPNQLLGNISIIGSFNRPSPDDAICYVSEVSNSALAINPETRRIVKNYS